MFLHRFLTQELVYNKSISRSLNSLSVYLFSSKSPRIDYIFLFEYDSNSIISFERICFHTGLQSIRPIYTSYKSHEKSDNSLYSMCSINPSHIVKIVGFALLAFLQEFFI